MGRTCYNSQANLMNHPAQREVPSTLVPTIHCSSSVRSSVEMERALLPLGLTCGFLSSFAWPSVRERNNEQHIA